MWSGTPAWGWSGGLWCAEKGGTALGLSSALHPCLLGKCPHSTQGTWAPQGWHVWVSSRSQAVLGELSPWLQSCRRE